MDDVNKNPSKDSSTKATETDQDEQLLYQPPAMIHSLGEQKASKGTSAVEVKIRNESGEEDAKNVDEFERKETSNAVKNEVTILSQEINNSTIESPTDSGTNVKLSREEERISETTMVANASRSSNDHDCTSSIQDTKAQLSDQVGGGFESSNDINDTSLVSSSDTSESDQLTAEESKCEGQTTGVDASIVMDEGEGIDPISPETDTANDTEVKEVQQPSPSTPEVLLKQVKKSSPGLQFKFPPSTKSKSRTAYNQYTQESWEAQEFTRKLVFCGQVTMLEKGKYFWSEDEFVPRTLVLFENPHILIIAKCQQGSEQDQDTSNSLLLVQRVVDLQTCKLRLSTLTTPTSVGRALDNSSGTGELKSGVTSTAGFNCRSMSCFEIMTPSDNISISAMKNGDNSKMTYAATARWEAEIRQAILSAYGIDSDEACKEDNDSAMCNAAQCEAEGLSGTTNALNQGLHSIRSTTMTTAPKVTFPTNSIDLTMWRNRHQVIIGTLHSHVVSGNANLLKQYLSPRGSPLEPFPNIDHRDGAGLTPLHYACYKRSHTLVTILLNAGANCSLPTEYLGRNTPCHISASLLDEKSLSVILSSSKPCRADPNALNQKGETPMAVALNAGAGRDLEGGACVLALDPIDSDLGSGVGSRNMCLDVLRAWGGQVALTKSRERIAARNENNKKRNPLQSTREDEDSAKNMLFGSIGRAMKNIFSDDDDLEKEVAQDSVQARAQSIRSRYAPNSSSTRKGASHARTSARSLPSQSTNDRVSGLMGSMNASRNAFNERGEKLNTLAEKTGALKDASEDFAKMAEELRKQQERGIFGLW